MAGVIFRWRASYPFYFYAIGAIWGFSQVFDFSVWTTVELVRNILVDGDRISHIIHIDTRGYQFMNHQHSALHLATYFGWKKVIELLLLGAEDSEDSTEFSINQRTHQAFGPSPIHIAARRGDTSTLAFLLSVQGIDPDLSCGPRNTTPLFKAASHGHVDAVRLLMKRGDVDINAINTRKYTPLTAASEAGHREVVAVLLGRQDIDVNHQCIHKRTALLLATTRGHDPIVDLLLRHKQVDVNLADSSGHTPIFYAAKQGHLNILRMLLEAGGVEPSDYFRDDLLTVAAKYGQHTIVHFLLEHTEINFRFAWNDSSRDDVLLWAAERGYAEVLHLLLTHRKTKDIWSTMKEGRISPNNRFMTVESLLMSKGIQINCKDFDGRIPSLATIKEAITRNMHTKAEHDENERYEITTGNTSELCREECRGTSQQGMVTSTLWPSPLP
jgi:ankyrin repeat protein